METSHVITQVEHVGSLTETLMLLACRSAETVEDHLRKALANAKDRDATIKEQQLRICHLESHTAILRGERDHYREEADRLRKQLAGMSVERPEESHYAE